MVIYQMKQERKVVPRGDTDFKMVTNFCQKSLLCVLYVFHWYMKKVSRFVDEEGLSIVQYFWFWLSQLYFSDFESWGKV